MNKAFGLTLAVCAIGLAFLIAAGKVDPVAGVQEVGEAVASAWAFVGEFLWGSAR